MVAGVAKSRKYGGISKMGYKLTLKIGEREWSQQWRIKNICRRLISQLFRRTMHLDE
jgi:hypothetical protein